MTLKTNQSNLVSKFNFDNFVLGRSNAIAHSAAIQIIDHINDKENSLYTPFVVYGECGLGKTHFINAIGHSILEREPDKKVVYITANDFRKEVVYSIHNKKSLEFQESYKSVDVFLFDDLQNISGKEKTQEEFLLIMDDLLNDQKQIIITSEILPQNITEVNKQLKSRISSGLLVNLGLPDIEMRMSFLEANARFLNFDLSYDVALFLSEKLGLILPELGGVLKRLMLTEYTIGEKLSLKHVQYILRDIISVGKESLTE